MNECQFGPFTSFSCFWSALNNAIEQISVFLNLHGFWIYFILGAVILLLFSRDRLDRTIELQEDAAAGETTAEDLDDEIGDFEKFVKVFRPSEICMIRAFKWAWFYYAGVLVLLYSVFAFFIAVALGLIQLPGEIAGIIYENFVAPSLDGFMRLASGEVASVAATSDLSGATAENSAPVVFALDEPVQSIAEQPPVETESYQLQELPLVLALMVVGLLPTSRKFRKIENSIREFSLHFAGIPWRVIRTWKQLSEEPLFQNSLDQEDVPLLHDKLAFLNERRDLMVQARTYATRLVGAERFEKDYAALGLVFTFEALTLKSPCWPNDEIKELYGRRSLLELHREIVILAEDLAHFVELNSIKEQLFQAQKLIANRGFGEKRVGFERAGQSDAAQDEEVDPIEIMQRRWDDLMSRVNVVADQTVAMFALYVERVPDLPKGELKFELLGDWVKRAKDVVVEEDPRRSKAGYTLAILGSVALFVFFNTLRNSGLLPFNLDISSATLTEPVLTDAERIKRRLEVLDDAFLSTLKAGSIFLSAALVLAYLRDQAIKKYDWRHYGTPKASASYFQLAFWSFFWGVLLSFAAYSLWSTIEIRNFRASVSVVDTFGDLFELGRPFNALMLSLWALQAAVVAVVTAAVCDVWRNEETARAARLFGFGIVLFASLMLLELLLPEIVKFFTRPDEAFNFRLAVGVPGSISIFAFALASAVFVIVRVRARRE